MKGGSSDKVRGRLKVKMKVEESKRGVIYGVQEEVQAYMQTGKENIRFGIVEERFIKAHWVLGNAGSCKWIMTKDQPCMKRKGDP
mmetsp:Transcript_5670/g.8719  ORF Transcript_5670/g.8719 Transcript_5670/m.8719 type:complete len:85 (+) Transcript_5670:810-1064(+)